MKQINLELIRSFNPCYNPTKYLPEDWTGTAIDLLNIKEIPFEDALWVLMRTDFVSEKLMRLFAVWCARQVQHLMKDKRSLDALDVAERFANGVATTQELDAAREAAWDAWDDARDAARAAACAAWDAARDAARNAARTAAWDASWAAAWDAQRTKLIEMILAGVETGDTK